jgi:hypothetical protein
MKKLSRIILSTLCLVSLSLPVQAGNLGYLRGLVAFGNGGDINHDGTINGIDWYVMTQAERIATVSAFLVVQHNNGTLNVNSYSKSTIESMVILLVPEVTRLYSRLSKHTDIFTICRIASGNIAEQLR